VWNFFITILTIYTLFVSPYIYVFKDVYQEEITLDDGSKAYADRDKNPTQMNLYKIELVIDIIYTFEICLNFVKKTRAHKELSQIATNYIFSFFIFDVAATIPGLLTNESLDYYLLKCFRLVHVDRLT